MPSGAHGQIGAPAAEEIARLRDKLFCICLAVTDPDLDHLDRCVAVMTIAGSAEDWRL